MIIDSISNASFYAGMHKGIKAGLDFITSTNLLDIEPGTYDIDKTSYAIVQEYTTKPVSEGIWEAHRKFIDIQYVVSGSEMMGYFDINNLKVIKEYDPENDVLFLEGEGDYIKAPAGTFLIFAPQDAHKPCLTLDKTQKVRKVVVKVKI